jgi:hypothetical protein
MNAHERQPEVESIVVDRVEDAHFVLTVIYSNGVAGELRVKENEEERYDRETLNHIFATVFGRHNINSLPAVAKEELLLTIEKAILSYKKQKA